MIARVNQLVFKVKPCTDYDLKPFDVHAARLRRFAGAYHLNMTEQLKLDVQWDHRDNVVSKIVKHQVDE